MAVAYTLFIVSCLLIARQGNRAASTLRKNLSRLGGAWVKLGQVLAHRPDLVPASWCREFSLLLDSIPGFDVQLARRIVTEELGAPVDALFASFDDEPLAAASIAQVHTATLSDGVRVAVKIQRPGIGAAFASDIRLMRIVARLVDFAHPAADGGATKFVASFAQWTAKELDFLAEGAAAEELRRGAEGDRNEQIPQVFWSHTTRRVLTTEFVAGTSIKYLVDDGSTCVNWEVVARRLLWNSLNQFYVTGVFHADLHAANIFVVAEDRIAYVDFGIVGRFSMEQKRSLQSYAAHLFCGDVRFAASELLRWVNTRPEKVNALREELSSELEEMRSAPSEDQARSALTHERRLLELFRVHHASMDWRLSLYFKSLSSLNALIAQLSPSLDLRREASMFFELRHRSDNLGDSIMERFRSTQRLVPEHPTMVNADSSSSALAGSAFLAVAVLAAACSSLVALVLGGVAVIVLARRGVSNSSSQRQIEGALIAIEKM